MIRNNKIKILGLVAFLFGFEFAAFAQDESAKIGKFSPELQTKMKETYRIQQMELQLKIAQERANLYVVLLEDKNNESKAKSKVEKIIELESELFKDKMEIRNEIGHSSPDFMQATKAHRYHQFPSDERKHQPLDDHRMLSEKHDIDAKTGPTPQVGRNHEFEDKVPSEMRESSEVKAVKTKYLALHDELMQSAFSEQKMNEMIAERNEIKKQLCDLKIDEFYEMLTVLSDTEKVAYRMKQAKAIAFQEGKTHQGVKQSNHRGYGAMNVPRP
ncbi:MAG: hypothetical protein ACK5IJ_12105 [Mangrovibacterium sp.]